MLIGNLLVGLLAFGAVEARAINSTTSQQHNCTLLPNPNSSHNLYCGAYGAFAGTVSILGIASTAPNLSGCAATCRANSGCISFGFNSSTEINNCQLFSRSLKDMKLAVTDDGQTIYYNKRCWRKSCAATSSAPSSTGLTGCTCTSNTTATFAAAQSNKKKTTSALCDVVAALRASSGTPFCNTFLSVGTSTLSRTQTTTLPATTIIRTSTLTAPLEKDIFFATTSTVITFTDTSVYTPTVTTIETMTSVSTYSCFPSATTLTSSVVSNETPVIEQDFHSVQSPSQASADATSTSPSTSNGYFKRSTRVDPATTTTSIVPSVVTLVNANYSIPTYLSQWDNSMISSACRCLTDSPSTVTATTILSLTSGNLTVSETTTTTPITTMTITSTLTISTTATTTSTTNPVTSTLTNTLVIPSPSGLATGLNYYVYPSTLDYDYADPGFSAPAFNNPNYTYSSFLSDVDSLQTYDYGSGSTTCYLPPSYSPAIDCAYIVIVMQGYFYAAAGAGTYTIYTPDTIDNALYFWSGAAAYSQYTNSNTAYQAVRAGTGPFTAGTTTLTLAEFELVPVTIMWVNGGGIGAAFMSVQDPAGNLYDEDTSGFFLPADDQGSCPGLVSPFSP